MLPVAQLESLRFKASQIIDSIHALGRAVDNNGLPFIQPWPDLLSKYNVILSQTTSFYASLQGSTNYEHIALYPGTLLSDHQLDNDLIPLLRNQQTTDVLRIESATVRRLAECMSTRGAIATDALDAQPPAPSPSPFVPTLRQRVTHDDVLRECAEIREAHDRRVQRAVRAVLMLKDKFDWKQRVEVEEPEPEELEWDPRTRQQHMHAQDVNDIADVEGQSSDEEEVVEGELAGDDGQSPPADADMEPAER